MTPAAHVRGDGLAGFVKLDGHAACHEMRGGGKANRTTTDHGDRKFQMSTGDTHAGSLAFFFRVAVPGLRPVAQSTTPAQQFSVRYASNPFIVS